MTERVSSRISRILGLRGVRDSALVAGLNFAGQGIALLVLPLSSRLFSIDAFARLAELVAVGTVLAVVSSARLETAALRHTDGRISAALFRAALVAVCVVSTISVLIGWVLAGLGVAMAVGACCLGLGGVVVGERAATRQGAFLLLGSVRLVLLVLGGVLPIVLAPYLGDAGLVWGYSSACMIAGALAVAGSYSQMSAPVAGSGMAILRLVWAERWFVASNLPHALLSSFALSMPVAVLKMFGGSAEVAHYGVAQRLLLGPASVIGAALLSTNSRAAVAAHDKRLEAQRQIRFAWLCLIASAALAVLFQPLIDDAIRMFLGERWLPAAGTMRLLLPVAVMTFVVGPLAFLPAIFDRQASAFRIEVATFALKASGMVIIAQFIGPRFAVLGLAVTSAVAGLYQIIWTGRMVQP